MATGVLAVRPGVVGREPSASCVGCVGMGAFARPPSEARASIHEDVTLPPVTLSVVVITYNEESNLSRTLESAQPLVRDGHGEIIIVDSGSTDRTVEIAKSFGAKVFIEDWKGYAAQKNSAIDKATGDWILSLDADESLGSGLPGLIHLLTSKPNGFTEIELQNLAGDAGADSLDQVELVMAYEEEVMDTTALEKQPLRLSGYYLPRQNFFLRRWIRHGGFWPDPKLRLFKRGQLAESRTAVFTKPSK